MNETKNATTETIKTTMGEIIMNEKMVTAKRSGTSDQDILAVNIKVTNNDSQTCVEDAGQIYNGLYNHFITNYRMLNSGVVSLNIDNLINEDPSHIDITLELNLFEYEICTFAIVPFKPSKRGDSTITVSINMKDNTICYFHKDLINSIVDNAYKTHVGLIEYIKNDIIIDSDNGLKIIYTEDSSYIPFTVTI